MFPSQQLISYVFANPGDEYRCGDLLTLNLQQYLWKSLHQHYDTVYFLRSTDGHAFSVRTFQERNAVRPSNPKFWQSHEEVFGKWLQSQLRKSTAIVCPMDMFCQVFSQDAWAPILTKIANDPSRAGIFVLTASPYAEDSRQHLTESPVFELLGEHTVTGSRGRRQSVYSAIRREKPENCRFLNDFTPDRINDLLLHVCSAYPERCMSPQARMSLAADLAARLQSGRDIPGLQKAPQPAVYRTYRWLYAQLCTQAVWDQLVLPDRDRLPFRESGQLPLLHTPACCAGKCISLQLPPWVRDQRDSGGRSPAELLRDIRALIPEPGNCPENRELADTACGFMKQLGEVDQDDVDTCSLILDALRFCVKWIHIHREDSNYEEVFRILNGLKVSTANSVSCFRGNRELSAREANPPASGQEWLALMNSRKKLNEKINTLQNYVSLLKANIFTMETSGYVDSSVLMDVFTKEMQNTDTDEFALTGDHQSSYTPYSPAY